jgi:hypothetical protein
MLQKQTVKPALLELLNFLMNQEIFKGYYLVGGTSLALQLGHRESVDIDLFGNEEINEIEFTLKDLISFYKLKYTDGSEFLVLKSLTYFEDADLENSPKMYLSETWDTIKQFIINKTLEYLNK